MSDHQERRHFKRVPFDAPTELVQGGQRWPVNLLDISLKGILIESPEPWKADPEQLFDAVVHLSGDAQVRMQVQLRHIGEQQLGFICQHIDLHSLEHLCRLIELNLADCTELQREFHELIKV